MDDKTFINELRILYQNSHTERNKLRTAIWDYFTGDRAQRIIRKLEENIDE